MRSILTITCASVLAMSLASAATPRTDQGKTALKAELEMLMKRVNELEAKERAVGNITEKEAVTTGNNLNLKITGNVSRAVQHIDNGRRSNTVHVDPVAATQTRIRAEATGKISEGFKAGGVIEFGVVQNGSVNVDVHKASDGTNGVNRRIVEAYFDNKRWGKVTLGHGWTAASLVTRSTDMSKTGALAPGDTVGNIAAGTTFVDKTIAGTDPGSTSVYPDLGKTNDGTTLTVAKVFYRNSRRKDRVQYTTPEFWGTQASVSHHYTNRNDNWEVSVKHAHKFMGTKIKAHVAYSHDLSNAFASLPAKFDQVEGSISVLFPIGINFMFAGTHRDWKLKKAPDASIIYFKAGYLTDKVFEAGVTALAFDWGRWKNFVLDRATADSAISNKYVGKTYGAILTQHIDRIGTALYVAARVFKLDGQASKTARYKDITTVLGGVRIKF